MPIAFPFIPASSPAPVLTRESLTQRFTLFQHQQHALPPQKRAALAAEQTLTPAAVMLALAERNNALFLLLTKRAAHLKHHPGQISFPGGKVEKSDVDVIDTAIRETAEEIGVAVNKNQILGCLSPLPTVTGYLITPVIGFIEGNYQPRLDENEVAALFELPLNEVTAAGALRTQWVYRKKQRYPIYAMHFQQHLIWGATAQILHTLNQQLLPELRQHTS